jgi:uncharacterized protein (TIGR03118 family)
MSQTDSTKEQTMLPVLGEQSKVARLLIVGAHTAAAALCLSVFAPTAQAQYQRTDLVSNQAGMTPVQDQHLVNGWGLVSLPTSPFWVSDNGTGFSTLYTGAGAQVPLVVAVPPAPSSPAGSLGMPTGLVGNISPNPTDFTVSGNGKSGQALFIFDTFDGTISAWSPAVALNQSTITTDRSGAGAIYTGLAIAVDKSNKAFLYAADDGPNRRIDMFDSSFNFVKSFNDPEIPQDFAPYGIQAINGQIWVTYTSIKKAQSGFVDVFDTAGILVNHLAVTGPLHSPWGVALAPANFGPMSNAILISNNTPRGQINAFNPKTGEFLGALRDLNGKAIEIDNIWAIQFGQGAAANGPANHLFFTAGPNAYANGLFGTITVGN